MSVVGNNRVGIPIVVLHDAEGSIVSVETKAGEIIRGLLFEAEDMMNLYIKNAIVCNAHGTKRKVDQLYLRGSEILFIVIPSMLRHAPMFLRIKHWRKYKGGHSEGVGAAVGQAAAILRKANERRQIALAAGRGALGARVVSTGAGGGRGGSAGRGGGGSYRQNQPMAPSSSAAQGGYYGPR